MKLDEVYLQYADTVYRYLLSLSGNPDIAEEMTQETFFRAVKSSSSFDGNVKITTWLCAIAKNAYFNYVKKERRKAADTSDMEIAVPENVLDRENCREIYKTVHLLDEPYREIILLRMHTDMTFAEIGDIFGKSEGWARVSFYRGKEKLKKMLEAME